MASWSRTVRNKVRWSFMRWLHRMAFATAADWVARLAEAHHAGPRAAMRPSLSGDVPGQRSHQRGDLGLLSTEDVDGAG